MDLNEVWSIMHPKIIELSKPRIESGQYADAVSAVFRQIELSVRKTFVEKGGDGKEFGVDLMRKAFDIRDENQYLNLNHHLNVLMVVSNGAMNICSKDQ